MNKSVSFKILKTSFFSSEGIEVGSGGLMTSNGVNFFLKAASASGGKSFIQIDFRWRANFHGLDISDGIISISAVGSVPFGLNDHITGNLFQTTISVPALDYNLTPVSTKNSFFDNVILIGGYNGATPLELNPLGVAAYEFGANFLIQSNSTVNVDVGANIQIDDNAVLTVDGTFNVTKPSTFKILKSGFFDSEGIDVDSGGLMTSAGANYSQTTTTSGGTASFHVESGGAILMTGGSIGMKSSILDSGASTIHDVLSSNSRSIAGPR